MPSGDSKRDTIAAVATPPGRGGIGVVRISGPQVPQIAAQVIGSVPPARAATLARFSDARGAAIDEGIAVYFPAPHSYTGEAVLELQGHGGPVVLGMLLSACLDAGARLAGPGEFTRRAFLEGRLDLAQAEAVADLIDASSQEAARSALRSLSGEFSAAIDALLSQLVELRALTEAQLDFPEEELDGIHRDDAAKRLVSIQAAVDDVLARSKQGSLLRSGVYVVLAGAPNVGKSSLLNRLAGAERAIVTPIPGTTRDALRETIHIDGVAVVLVDTAGLRESADEVEKLGIARTRSELERADVVLAVHDATAGTAAVASTAQRIDVYNKTDLRPGFVPPKGAIAVSAKTGQGVPDLREAIVRAAGWSSTGESVFLARERHLRALTAAKEHLVRATAEKARWELFAEELRLAHESLSAITGAFTADDLLGEIFGRFCIGK
ncbi:MAG: tRNA uridine-5-carboxymethylaminomethyl(34) synthesis GTPase MnmE [Betaproteobacteria bacterium]|nr:tRNA uridine-5-carboxymethylaminomethyl(34) synthesis GTPase MnmE [Betaproteobacteria bacterium]MBV9360581.1 tRNA uridine-5-carboxymethylaminomethyl(34) synthesis GTPase MnmE [Betaproteobacteria bacterium]